MAVPKKPVKAEPLPKPKPKKEKGGVTTQDERPKHGHNP